MIDRAQHWLFPELLRFNSRVAGRRALQLARIEIIRSRRTLVLFFALLAVAIAADQLVKWLLVPQHPRMIYVADAILLACVFFFLTRTRSETRVQLRRYLRMDNIDICVKCGYDTTGIDESCCPECGEHF